MRSRGSKVTAKKNQRLRLEVKLVSLLLLYLLAYKIQKMTPILQKLWRNNFEVIGNIIE